MIQRNLTLLILLTYNCITSPLFSSPPPPSPHDALFILNDSVPYVIFKQTANWEARYGLFNYLFTVDSSLVDSSTVIKHFFDSAKTANIGKIAEISKLLGDPNGVSANELSLAQSLNSSIQNPDTAESIYQAMYSIMIDMDNAGGQYIPSVPNQVTTLKSIAPLCPGQWGNGVFLARALLSQIDTTVWPYPCMPSNNNEDDHKPNIHTSDSLLMAKVYPNPANTLLNIELPLSQGETATICLYNSIGQLVRCETIYEDVSTISSADLASGIYYYRITGQNGSIIKADKQMILH